MQFYFNPRHDVGTRIYENEIITLAGGNFELSYDYTVAMPKFMAKGGDGFSMFLKPEVETVVDEENGLGIIEIVKNFFKRTRTDFEVS